MADFLPKADLKLLRWSENFAKQMATLAQELHLRPQMVADYAAVHGRYAEALSIALNPMTRTMMAVAAKDDAKRELCACARRDVHFMRGVAGTDSQLEALQLSPRLPRRSRRPVPMTPIAITQLRTEGNRVSFKFSAVGTNSNRRDPDAIGANIYTCVGPQPPAELKDWKPLQFVTSGWVRIDYASDVPPGTQVWIVVAWLGSRGRQGAVSRPVSTRVMGGFNTLPAGQATRIAA